MIIGITGGTGCGKTTLLDVIRELGGTVLDCDAIYHRLLREDPALLTAIETRFPGTVKDGQLQRKQLGQIVFSDQQALADLNQITHSAVKAEVIRLLTPEPDLAAIDAIGLFESGLDKLCKLTVAVTAPEEDRIVRLMARDNISREYALTRIRAQRSCEDFSRLCDHTLHNDSTQDAFREKCLAFLAESGIMKKENNKGEFL
ncbi:MAG: dephospho-CoA kinase [Oscillospiraceae bacterium]|nr:dephospho-CoA kinase [Oscillospiraceae bacterium]